MGGGPAHGEERPWALESGGTNPRCWGLGGSFQLPCTAGPTLAAEPGGDPL